MIEKQNGSWHLTGKITFANVVRVRTKGKKTILENKIDCLDLSTVISNDSSILALLLAWKREAKMMAINLKYINLSDNLKSIVKVCNVQTILE